MVALTDVMTKAIDIAARRPTAAMPSCSSMTARCARA